MKTLVLITTAMLITLSGCMSTPSTTEKPKQEFCVLEAVTVRATLDGREVSLDLMPGTVISVWAIKKKPSGSAPIEEVETMTALSEVR